MRGLDLLESLPYVDGSPKTSPTGDRWPEDAQAIVVLGGYAESVNETGTRFSLGVAALMSPPYSPSFRATTSAFWTALGAAFLSRSPS
jgi:hypothetical protein